MNFQVLEMRTLRYDGTGMEKNISLSLRYATRESVAESVLPDGQIVEQPHDA